MSKSIIWAPSDYSPTYKFDVDNKGNFIKLNKVFDIPPAYPEHKEIKIKQFHIDYMSGEGFEKYKSLRIWLGDKLYT